jgi:hypothetical protein
MRFLHLDYILNFLSIIRDFNIFYISNMVTLLNFNFILLIFPHFILSFYAVYTFIIIDYDVYVTKMKQILYLKQ